MDQQDKDPWTSGPKIDPQSASDEDELANAHILE